VTAPIVREAEHGGQCVAQIRCYDGENGTSIVEAELTPVGSDAPIKRGPYTFATANEAIRFMQEAVLALQYLGCSVG
jgi:hypothetical protein